MKTQLIAAAAGIAMLGFGGAAFAEEDKTLAPADVIELTDVAMDEVTAAGWYYKYLPINLAYAEAGASAQGAVTKTYTDTYTTVWPGGSLSLSKSSSATCCSGKSKSKKRW